MVARGKYQDYVLSNNVPLDDLVERIQEIAEAEDDDDLTAAADAIQKAIDEIGDILFDYDNAKE